VTRYGTGFDTDEQAVVEAFFLGLRAPGESEAEAASMLAEELAAGMARRRWRSAGQPRLTASNSRRGALDLPFPFARGSRSGSARRAD
jgi:hypothetical protein